MRLTVISAAAALGAALASGHALAEESAQPGSAETSEEAELLDYEDDPLFDLELDALEPDDPWETANRGIFAFNRVVDRWAWRPITATYQFIVPTFFRRGIHRIFLNAETPAIVVNQLLQAEWRASGLTIARFVLNSTAGYGGFFDAADIGAGWKRHDEDFGQTLAVWGLSSGPYVVIPVIGPSTVRDSVGTIVDRSLDPLTFIIGPLKWILFLGAGEGISIREANADALRELEESSIDFYAALRSAYFQVRESDIANHIEERERQRAER